jgi:hypothetical protein
MRRCRGSGLERGTTVLSTLPGVLILNGMVEFAVLGQTNAEGIPVESLRGRQSLQMSHILTFVIVSE